MRTTITALPLLCLAPLAAQTVTVRPADTGVGLANPDMGWVLHYYDNSPNNYGSRLAPSDTLPDFPGLQVIYLRIAWSLLEPEEGRFCWTILDAPAQRWLGQGKQLALRLTTSETPVPYATPKWVEEAGAKGYHFTPGKGGDPEGTHWEPDFGDPIFLVKLDHFLGAVAAHFDPQDLSFVDIGTIGVWGEGHTYHSTKKVYPREVLEQHIALHRKHFPHTLLAINDDYVMHEHGEEVIAQAAKDGLTLRDDSIMVQPPPRSWYHAEMAQQFWPHVPVIIESEHYGGSVARKAWVDDLYLKSVEEYHGSLMSIHWWPREFLEKCGDLIGRMNLRIGYRLQLTEASWPRIVPRDGSFQAGMQWRNAGVAPCYPGGHPALTLKDAEGGIVGVFVLDRLDVRRLPVGAPGEAAAQAVEQEFSLPWNLHPGDYEAYVSVGKPDGTPVIALPLADEDGHRRYRLGRLRVTGDYDVQPGAMTRDGDGWQLGLTWTVLQPIPEGTKPFCHFDDATDRIVFQGFPVGADDPAWRELGESQLPCRFTIPEAARGQRFRVRIGLFQPSKMGRPDERLMPNRDDGDRRVTAGTLTVSAEGQPEFTPLGNQE